MHSGEHAVFVAAGDAPLATKTLLSNSFQAIHTAELLG